MASLPPRIPPDNGLFPEKLPPWRRPENLYIASAAAAACFFGLAFTLAAVYRVETAQLNPLQLILVGTVLELAVFLFEIPTGLLADRHSRKWSVVFGFALVGLGFLVEGSLPLFGWILTAQALWGIGFTFTDGAQTAWLADAIEPRPIGPVLLRSSQAASIGSLIGIGGAMVLGQRSLAWPLLGAGALFIFLAAFLAVAMSEEKKPNPEKAETFWDHWQPVVAGWRLLQQKPVLWLLLGAALFAGLASEGIDRYWELHFLQNVGLPDLAGLPPLYWFGIINAVSMLLTLAAAEFARRRLDFSSTAFMAILLSVINALHAAAIVVFALSGQFGLALAAYFTLALMRSVHQPIYEAWFNQYLNSELRATMLSVISLVNSLGQIAGGPLIGWTAARFGVPAALIATAGLLIPVSVLYLRTRRQGAAPVEETPAE